MTILKTNGAGGIFPSASPRALADGAAQVAHNVLASVAELRPLADDVRVATINIANPKTLHRFARKADGSFSTDMRSGWIAREGVVNFVKGQIDDDTTERTYYTFGDGSAPPRVTDATGDDRRLGVPAPSVEPGAQVQAGQYFTPDDRTGAISSIRSDLKLAGAAGVAERWVGIIRPGETTPGLLDASRAQVGIGADMALQVFSTTSRNGANNGAMDFSYIGADPAILQWVFDPRLGGVWRTADDSWPSWAGRGIDHWCLPIPAYGRSFIRDADKLVPALRAIKKPGGSSDESLFTESDIVRAVRYVQEQVIDGVDKAVTPLMSQIQSRLDQLRGVFIGGGRSSITANYPAFYAQAYVQQYFSNVCNQFAQNSFQKASEAVIQDSFSFQYDGGSAAGRMSAAAVTRSNVYWGGDRAQAVAYVGSYARSNWFITGADGMVRLNRGAAAEWLVNEYQLMHDAGEVRDQKFIQAIDVWGLVNQMGDQVDPAFFNADPNWPTTAPQVDTDSVAATTQLLSEMRRLSDQITQAGGDAPVRAGNLLVTMFGNELEPGIPVGEAIRKEARIYVYTWVNDRNEESAPSPASPLIELGQFDKVLVGTNVAFPPAGRNIEKWRIYRSNTSNQAAALQFVNEKPVTQMTFLDDIPGAGLQESCPTLTWAEPPVNLQGLVGMPNGFMAGHFDNTVAFCVAFNPYAWPVDFQITTEHPIVGLGVWNQTLFVGTRGTPYFMSGSDPASMSAQKLDSNQACVSPRSIVATEGGVVFASPDGMCIASSNGVRLITGAHFTREDWRRLNPASIIAVEHERVLYLFYNDGNNLGCYALHMETGRLTTTDLTASAVYVDRVTDSMYTANGTDVVAVFGGIGRRSGKYRTRIEVLPGYSAFAWLAVQSDFAGGSVAVVRIYADGELWHRAEVFSRKPVRMPTGRKQEIEIEVESRERITGVTLTSSTAELQSIS